MEEKWRRRDGVRDRERWEERQRDIGRDGEI